MFFRTHTVDKAIAPLLKAQKDLNAVAQERSVLIESSQKRVEELEADSLVANAERYRAERIALALKAITEPEGIVDPDDFTPTVPSEE